MVTTDAMSDLELARKVLRIEAEAILGLVDRLDERVRARRSDLLLDCRGRVILTGMGKSGIICRKIAATLVQHRHAGVLPPPRRGHPRRPRRASRRTTCVVALSYSGETEELLRLLETIRRVGAKLIAITGFAALDAGAGRRRRARLPA